MELIAVVYLGVCSQEAAQELASHFGLPCVDGSAVAAVKPKFFQRFLVELCSEAGGGFIFVHSDSGLVLHSVGEENVSINADFHGPTVTYRRKQGGGKGQMIAKAVGLRGGVVPKVLDATAGLGGDAFVLASLGCDVTMLERVPAVRALLADALVQAKRFALEQDAELLEVMQRMRLVEADALNYLRTVAEGDRPDVIYLDPMFPARTKSAMVKKEMRVFHHLVGTDPDADGLLDAALSCARYRVVVKRPRIAAALAGPAPSHVLEGKSNRYDVYTIEKLPDGLNVGVDSLSHM